MAVKDDRVPRERSYLTNPRNHSTRALALVGQIVAFPAPVCLLSLIRNGRVVRHNIGAYYPLNFSDDHHF